MRVARARLPAILVCAALAANPLSAQSFRKSGTEFNAMRPVEIPADKDYSVAEVQFFHHGEISADGKNVLAFTRDQKPMPTRVLQLGPGDYCRLAFQTIEGQKSYELFYGGEPPPDAIPPWTSQDGLLLETRQYKDCNLNSVQSVREAFQSAKPIGAGYVPNVQHSHNPFSLKAEPFLSRYSGMLRIPSQGTYGFLTSSQDASFLLVDDKVVVEAPGRHGPLRRATRGTRKDIQLAAGPHKFEYYHAATGPQATMVAAWEVSPKDPKPQPSAIPSEHFRTQMVGQVQAGRVTMRTVKTVPDFLVNIMGEVPLPDNDLPLLGVQFLDLSPRGAAMQGKIEWHFGDGQTSEEAKPFHVYLRPDLYSVTCSVKRGGRTVETTNRIYIGRPKIFKAAEAHKLEQYLPVLETYNPATLDSASLLQFVLTYEFMVERALSPEAPEKKDEGSSAGTEAEPDPEAAKQEQEARKARARQYIEAAVEAGKVAFLGHSAAEGDQELVELARSVAPMARDDVGDSLLAARIWHGAAGRIADTNLKAECEAASADIAVNELVNQKAAKTLLDAASSHLQREDGPVASRLQRVWGDYYAMTGDGEKARQAYLKAEAILTVGKTHIERIAWQGAHARSTEQFIKTGELDRAARQIHAWENEFPAEKIGGYLTLMHARYWAGREMYDQAVAMAEQLTTVNPGSPYADRILLLAAECEVKRDRLDRALATLHSILTDYPGSPLVPEVKEKIATLESGESQKPKSRSGRRSGGG
jgi:PKD repeat protein